jgi:hypothetical protein
MNWGADLIDLLGIGLFVVGATLYVVRRLVRAVAAPASPEFFDRDKATTCSGCGISTERKVAGQ